MIYKIKPNNTVPELNAKIYTKTFPHSGLFLADLYRSKHESNIIVRHKTCPPIHGEFVKTIYLEL